MISQQDLDLIAQLKIEGLHAEAEDLERALGLLSSGSSDGRQHAPSRYDEFAWRGIPLLGERGYSPDVVAEILPIASRALSAANKLWEDGEFAPFLMEILGAGGLDVGPQEMLDEDPFWTAEDLPSLLGVPGLEPAYCVDIFGIVQALKSGFELDVRNPIVDDIPVLLVADIILHSNLFGISHAQYVARPSLTLVRKEVAEAYVLKHHSKLPKWNFRGLMYTIGVQVGFRLVAVAAIGHPSGAYSSRCDTRNVLELSRIASDGSTRGASSMLASRAMDLLPFSGRDGHAGLLFVTYSLLEEAGSTYAALIDKGLRPTRIRKGGKPSGQRAGASGEALHEESKLVWEAGPIAEPFNSEAMTEALRLSDPIRMKRLLDAGDEAAARLISSTSPEERVAKMKDRFDAWQRRQVALRKKHLSKAVADPAMVERLMTKKEQQEVAELDRVDPGLAQKIREEVFMDRWV